MGYRLRHPHGGRSLVVLGHYERTSGGCDTIPTVDGGLNEIFRLADAWATAGHDVFLEGSAWSAEHRRSAMLAGRHRMHVLLLSTPPEQSARSLAKRRRARRSTWPLIAQTLLAQREAIVAACAKLRGAAEVEEWEFNGALGRARELLGLRDTGNGIVPSAPARPIAIRSAQAKAVRTGGPVAESNPSGHLPC
jgi:hypothetical protein